MDTCNVNFRRGEPIVKPDLDIDYTQNMRTVDKSDRMISLDECVRKTVCWYNKLFLYLIDMTLLNAYNFRFVWNGTKPTSLRESTYAVSYQMLRILGWGPVFFPNTVVVNYHILSILATQFLAK